jgi:hypothetical protein
MANFHPRRRLSRRRGRPTGATGPPRPAWRRGRGLPPDARRWRRCRKRPRGSWAGTATRGGGGPAATGRRGRCCRPPVFWSGWGGGNGAVSMVNSESRGMVDLVCSGFVDSGPNIAVQHGRWRSSCSGVGVSFIPPMASSWRERSRHPPFRGWAAPERRNACPTVWNRVTRLTEGWRSWSSDRHGGSPPGLASGPRWPWSRPGDTPTPMSGPQAVRTPPSWRSSDAPSRGATAPRTGPPG